MRRPTLNASFLDLALELNIHGTAEQLAFLTSNQILEIQNKASALPPDGSRGRPEFRLLWGREGADQMFDIEERIPRWAAEVLHPPEPKLEPHQERPARRVIIEAPEEASKARPERDPGLAWLALVFAPILICCFLDLFFKGLSRWAFGGKMGNDYTLDGDEEAKEERMYVLAGRRRVTTD